MDVRNAEITPQDPASLVPLADFKTFIGVSDTLNDAIHASLLIAATAQIEGYCNALFSPRTVVETLINEDGGVNVLLGQSPVIALTSVTENGVATDVTKILLLKSAGIIRSGDGARFTPGATYVLTYTAGFAVPPAALAQAVKEYARDLYNLKDRAAGITKEEVKDVGSVTYADAGAYSSGDGPTGANLPPAIAAMVGPFVHAFNP